MYCCPESTEGSKWSCKPEGSQKKLRKQENDQYQDRCYNVPGCVCDGWNCLYCEGSGAICQNTEEPEVFWSREKCGESGISQTVTTRYSRVSTRSVTVPNATISFGNGRVALTPTINAIVRNIFTDEIGQEVSSMSSCLKTKDGEPQTACLW